MMPMLRHKKTLCVLALISGVCGFIFVNYFYKSGNGALSLSNINDWRLSRSELFHEEEDDQYFINGTFFTSWGIHHVITEDDDVREFWTDEDISDKVNKDTGRATTSKYNFKGTQASRKVHLNSACKRLKIRRTLPPVSWSTTTHFIISDKFKFLFCFVPKVACTTWKNVMKELYHNQVRDETKRRFVKLSEISSPKAVVSRWNNYRKVLFVREPLSRVLSAYLNKFRDKDEKKHWERAFGRYIVKLTRKSKQIYKRPYDITFEEFIRYILHLGPDAKMSQMRDHWLPYSSFTYPCSFKFDFIGHYETLAYDGPAIIQNLGVEKIAHFPKIHSSAAAESFRKEYAKVPVELIVKLQEYYRVDYDLFGYSKDESLKLALGGRP